MDSPHYTTTLKDSSAPIKVVWITSTNEWYRADWTGHIKGWGWSPTTEQDALELVKAGWGISTATAVDQIR